MKSIRSILAVVLLATLGACASPGDIQGTSSHILPHDVTSVEYYMHFGANQE